LVGDPGVGKSCFLLKFTDDIYLDALNPPTMSGVDFKVRTLNVNNTSVTLQIWDTAGQETFRNITSRYYRGAHGVIIMFDLTKKDTMYNLKAWLSDIEKYADIGVHKIIVGNKCDCKDTRVISQQDAENFIAGMSLEYVETSVKDNINVTKAFETLTKKILNDKNTTLNQSSNGVVNLARNQPAQKKCGCV
jgi:Ras-related protein Rab-1A